MSFDRRDKILKSFKPEALDRFNIIDHRDTDRPINWEQFKVDDLVIVYDKTGKISSYSLIGPNRIRSGYYYFQ